MKCMGEIRNEEFCPYCGNEIFRPVWLSDQLPEGTILNRHYIVGREIARDSIGITYIAWDAEKNERIAIKEWFPQGWCKRMGNRLEIRYTLNYSKEKEMKTAFFSFIMTQMKQRIPVLVDILSVFEENGTIYYALEYINGRTVRQILQEENPLSQKQANEILNQMLKASNQLHDSGIVHGNLNPDNVVLINNEEVCFLNRCNMDRRFKELYCDNYTAPEFYDDTAEPETNIDIYSIYAIYYRMITGTEPYSVSEQKNGSRTLAPKDMGIYVNTQFEKKMMDVLHMGGMQSGKKKQQVGHDTISRVERLLPGMIGAASVTLVALIIICVCIFFQGKSLSGEEVIIYDNQENADYDERAFKQEKESELQTEEKKTYDMERLQKEIQDIQRRYAGKWIVQITGQDIDQKVGELSLNKKLNQHKIKYLFVAERVYTDCILNTNQFPDFNDRFPDATALIGEMLSNINDHSDRSEVIYKQTLDWFHAPSVNGSENPAVQLTYRAENNNISGIEWKDIELEQSMWSSGKFLATPAACVQLFERIDGGVKKNEETYVKLYEGITNNQIIPEIQNLYSSYSLNKEKYFDLLSDCSGGNLAYFGCISMEDEKPVMIEIVGKKITAEKEKESLIELLEVIFKYVSCQY